MVSEKTVQNIKQFIKFGIIGCMNTGISSVVNIAVLFLLDPLKISFDYMIANILAYICGTIWAYIGNRYFVFRVKTTTKEEGWTMFFKMLLSYAFTGIIVNNVLSFILINWIGISKFIAPICNLIITVPINYCANKFWAFKKKKAPENLS